MLKAILSALILILLLPASLSWADQADDYKPIHEMPEMRFLGFDGYGQSELMTIQLDYEIPGRFARFVIIGADPEYPVDQNRTKALFKEQADKYDYKDIKYLVYNKDQVYDASLRAYGSRDPNNGEIGFLVPQYVKDIENAKWFTAPKIHVEDLCRAYITDNRQATQDFSGQKLDLRGMPVKRLYRNFDGRYCYEGLFPDIAPQARILACSDGGTSRYGALEYSIFEESQKNTLVEIDFYGVVQGFDGHTLYFFGQPSGPEWERPLSFK